MCYVNEEAEPLSYLVLQCLQEGNVVSKLLKIKYSSDTDGDVIFAVFFFK